MTSARLRRELLSLSLPVTLQIVAQMIMSMADVYFVQRLSAKHVAALALAKALISIPLMVFVACLNSLKITAAEQGETSREHVHVVAFHGVVFALVAGCLIAVAGTASASTIGSIGAPSEVRAFFVPCFQILSWSVAPALVFVALRETFFGCKDVKAATFFTVIGCALNFTLDYIAMSNRWHFFSGLNGIALATVVTYGVMASGMVLTHLSRTPRKDRWRWMLRWQPIARIVHLGYPQGLQGILRSLLPTLLAFIMGSVNTSFLAIYYAVGQIWNLLFVPLSAISESICVLTVRGQAAGRRFDTLGVAYQGVTAVLAYSSVAAVVAYLTFPYFATGDTLAPAVGMGLAWIMLFAGIDQAMLGIYTGLWGVVRGMRRMLLGVTGMVVMLIVTPLASMVVLKVLAMPFYCIYLAQAAGRVLAIATIVAGYYQLIYRNQPGALRSQLS